MNNLGAKEPNNVKRLSSRIQRLEQDMKTAKADIVDLKNTTAKVSDDTSEILELMKGAKGIAGFAVKWGRALALAAVGAGLFNPQVTAFIKSILAV
jgi:lysozyme family protein